MSNSLLEITVVLGKHIAVTVLYFENLKSLLATRINYKWQTLILQKLLISEKADITLACFDKY